MNPAMTGGAPSPRCLHHADRAATATCHACRSPLCSACTFVFKGQEACEKCNVTLRAGGTVAPTAAYGQPNPWAAPPPPAPAAANFGQQVVGGYAPAQEGRPAPGTLGPPVAIGLTVGRIFAGIGLGALFGVLGAALWIAVLVSTHIEFGLLASAIGWAVGFGVHKGCREGGVVPAALGAVLAFLSLMLGFLFHPTGMDWLFIAFGVYGGIKVPLHNA